MSRRYRVTLSVLRIHTTSVVVEAPTRDAAAAQAVAYETAGMVTWSDPSVPDGSCEVTAVTPLEDPSETSPTPATPTRPLICHIGPHPVGRYRDLPRFLQHVHHQAGTLWECADPRDDSEVYVFQPADVPETAVLQTLTRWVHRGPAWGTVPPTDIRDTLWASRARLWPSHQNVAVDPSTSQPSLTKE